MEKLILAVYTAHAGVLPSARMRIEGYGSACLSVCLSVYIRRTKGYEAAYERYQQL